MFILVPFSIEKLKSLYSSPEGYPLKEILMCVWCDVGQELCGPFWNSNESYGPEP